MSNDIMPGCRCNNCHRARGRARAARGRRAGEPVLDAIGAAYVAVEAVAADAARLSSGEGRVPEAWHAAARKLEEARRCVLMASVHARRAVPGLEVTP